MIEKWKDTAFGSDFGGDFLELVERVTKDIFSLDVLYNNTDVKKYLDNPGLLEERTDNNVNFTNSKFEQYIHFEDLIIALSAIIVASKLEGKVDLTKAYGTKIVRFRFQKTDILPVYDALSKIYNNPNHYILFEMCLEEERKETLDDIKEILIEFNKIIN